MRSYLSDNVPTYAGAELYVETAAVRDRHVITASGLAAVDFAREIFAELSVFETADEVMWFDMFKHGKLPESAS